MSRVCERHDLRRVSRRRKLERSHRHQAQQFHRGTQRPSHGNHSQLASVTSTGPGHQPPSSAARPPSTRSAWTVATAAPISPAAAARAKNPETRASQPLRQAEGLLRGTGHLILTALIGRGLSRRRPLRPATGHHSRSGSRLGGGREPVPKFDRDWRLRLHAADLQSRPIQGKSSP